MLGKVTKRTVDALKAKPSGDQFLWDRETKGFGVRVKPSGAKSFLIAYYAPGLHQVRRRLTLGAYGPLTSEEARKNATVLLAQVARGEDPAADKAEGRRAAKEETVEKLFAVYLADGVGRRKPRTMEFYESLGRLYLLPKLGRLPVATVTARDVAALHRSLRDKPVTANRVVRLVRAFYYWLDKRELVSGPNPARNTEWYPEQGRERFLGMIVDARDDVGGDLLDLEEIKEHARLIHGRRAGRGGHDLQRGPAIGCIEEERARSPG